MAERSRYDVGGDQGIAKKGVLKNKLGVSDQKILEDMETALLHDTYEYFFSLLAQRKIKFNLKLIFKIHSYFLSPLYSWAGKIRLVDISKSNVLFAKFPHIEAALERFEKLLSKCLPNQEETKEQIARKLAIIHCEFNAIHPFREGNGRTIRLFLDLIAVDLNFSPIDFSKTENHRYIKACMAGMTKDYELMTDVIEKGLKKK